MMRSTVPGLGESIKRAAQSQYQNDNNREVTRLLHAILKVEKKNNKRLAHIEKLLRKK